jgi:two-component system, LytTR family, response regulator LytT
VKVMVAEDERLAREELLYLLSKEPDLHILPAASDGKQLMELVRQHQPDVVFLDVHMPGLDGVSVAEQLLKFAHPPLIVFATADEHHTLDAFRVEAVDYLLKPYDEQRLRNTLSRLRARLALHAERIPTKTNRTRAKLLIDDGSRMIVIDPRNIAFAEKTEKLTQIHLVDGQLIGSRMSLQELEDKLTQDDIFFRTHRSHLVNMECIEEMEPWFNGAYNLVLKDAKRSRIPLSRGAAKELIRHLQGE